MAAVEYFTAYPKYVIQTKLLRVIAMGPMNSTLSRKHINGEHKSPKHHTKCVRNRILNNKGKGQCMCDGEYGISSSIISKNETVTITMTLMNEFFKMANIPIVFIEWMMKNNNEIVESVVVCRLLSQMHKFV